MTILGEQKISLQAFGIDFKKYCLMCEKVTGWKIIDKYKTEDNTQVVECKCLECFSIRNIIDELA